MGIRRLPAGAIALLMALACPLHAQPLPLAEQANAAGSRSGVAGLLRAQALLDRAQFSPNDIEGVAGST